MPFWPSVLLALAVVTGVFGFSGLGAASAPVAQVLCLIFGALFLLSLLARHLNGGSPSRRSRHELYRPVRASERSGLTR
ncbi:DUF1328 domain-containing protein [Ponticoccus sp. (in: a-proteobacteria)]|uniref:DUF1328 domain-containing protein n=1 Tax=Ponticoccus sp. (in: a-proteobacteria) TaxID=1925025 RepID=UPI003AB33CEA